MHGGNFADYWAPFDGNDGPYAAYVSTLGDAERETLIDALRLAYCGGAADGPRSFAATAWAVRGVVPT